MKPVSVSLALTCVMDSCASPRFYSNRWRDVKTFLLNHLWRQSLTADCSVAPRARPWLVSNRMVSYTDALQCFTSSLPRERLLHDPGRRNLSFGVASKIRRSQFGLAPQQAQRETLPTTRTIPRSQA